MRQGVFDMTAEQYHKQKGSTLSYTGIKRLLEFPFRGCPALFKYLMDNPEPHKPAFDFGKAAHTLLLGKGDEVVSIDADSFKTKAAREARDEAYAAGKVPLIAHDYETVKAMVAAARSNPQVDALFQQGESEKVIYWHDEEYDLPCCAMLDYARAEGGIVIDYKTCASAHPDAVDRAMFDYGYFVQAAFYAEGAMKLGLIDAPAFLFLFQEKNPPYLTLPVQIGADQFAWGQALVKKAKQVLRNCLDTDTWPTYNQGRFHTSSLTNWTNKQLEEAAKMGMIPEPG